MQRAPCRHVGEVRHVIDEQSVGALAGVDPAQSAGGDDLIANVIKSIWRERIGLSVNISMMARGDEQRLCVRGYYSRGAYGGHCHDNEAKALDPPQGTVAI